MPIPKSNEIRYTDDIKFDQNSLQYDGKDIIIAGWATKEGMNLKGNNVLLESMMWDGAFELFNGRVLAFHDDTLPPIGKVEQSSLVNDATGKGLKVRVRIFGTDSNEAVIRAIKERVLDGFSLGYSIYADSMEPNGVGYDYSKIKVLEVSVVNIGANQEAKFEIVDSIKGNKIEDNKQYSTIHKEYQMADKIEKQFDDIQPVVDKLKTEIGDLKENLKAREKVQGELQVALKDFQDGKITEGVMKTIVSKLQPTIQELTDKIQKGNAIQAVEADQIQITECDMRGIMQSRSSNMQDKLEFLLLSQVDYKNSGATGQRLLRVRQMHDTLMVLCARAKYLNRPLGKVGLDIYAAYLNDLKILGIQKDAMGSPNTGFGLEFVEQVWSAEVIPYIRALGGWSNRCRQFMDINKLPYQAGRAKSYTGNINYTDNADRAKLTNYGTGVTTPTYVTHKAAVVVQDEWEEDSIVPIVPLLREEIMTAIIEGRNRAFLNGNGATGTSFDTGLSYITSDLESQHNGLRKYAFSTNQAAVIRTAATEGTLADVDVRSAIAKLGKKGLKPADLFWIAPIQLRSAFLGLYANASDYGAVRTKMDGVMPPIYGSELYIDGEFPTKLGDAGLYTGSTVDREACLLVHGPSWGVFSKRQFRLETDKDILTGQLAFVGSGRFAFEQIMADNTTAGDYSAGGIEFL
jgi:HK97 family phage prohead protease